jgi:queuine tRNA-ribosyltransferase
MFEILHEDYSGARVGRLHTAHGTLETPFFMPVATQGTVKTLKFKEVKELGYGAVISNAFVLYLRPGVTLISKGGGLHEFMGWDRAVFTDSGGFQMLNPDFLEKTDQKGVTFRSPFDNSRHRLTPESCIEIQNQLGSDIAMVLDALVPFDSSRKEQETAVERTTAWARRCKNAHNNSSQLLFAITQGGTHKDLRERSARELVEIGFDGYGIGGLSIGESKDEMHNVLSWQTAILPKSKPRYLMGVGSPAELVESISRGVDIFDSTFPTRNARHNEAYTFNGKMNLSRGKFRDDKSPIEDGCGCYSCQNHTRAYIHHLLRNHEITGQSLMTIHNLYFIEWLLKNVRDAIKKNSFRDFKEKTLKGLNPEKAGKPGL